MPNAYVHTSAVAGVNGQCIDGGFSFPHRTLGANMLKDELYGVDFDGTAVAPGETAPRAGLDLNNYSPLGIRAGRASTRPIRLSATTGSRPVSSSRRIRRCCREHRQCLHRLPWRLHLLERRRRNDVHRW